MNPHAATAILGFAFIVLTRRIYYRNFELFLCLLIVINFDFFHLIPRIGKFDIYREIVLIVVFFYALETFFIARIINKGRENQFKFGRFGKYVVFYFFLLLFGLIVATINGQSVVMGVKAIKWYPSIIIFFIVLARKIDSDKFLRYFVLIALTLSILVLCQYALYNKFHFFFFYDDFVDHIRGIGQIRGLRILEGNSVIVIGCLLSIGFLITKRNFFYLLCTALMLSVIVIVMQVRSQIATIFLTSFFLYLLHNGISTKKIGISIYLVCAMMIIISIIPMLTKSNIFSESRLIQTTLRDLDGISRFGGIGNINIRLLCLDQYWNLYKENWFLGRGILNINWHGNIDYYFQQRFNFHLIDLGVFHFVVNHGVLGWIFIFSLMKLLFKQLLKLNRYPILASYFISGIILMPIIDLFFRFDRVLLFGIFLALLEKAVSKIETDHYDRTMTRMNTTIFETQRG